MPRLRGGSWISITLAWDRSVQLLDQGTPGDNDVYDVGDSFFADPRADLDLFLMPAGANDVSQYRSRSVGANYNVEHIFFQLPAQSASYEIWIRQFTETNANYALAWWADPAPPPQPQKILYSSPGS